MNNSEYTRKIKYLNRENAKQSLFPVRVDADKWPEAWLNLPTRPFDLFRSRDFVVALYQDSGCIRMTVNRTMINRAGEWLEGISWDELMDLKRHIGYGENYAVEVLPRDSDIVNVAAMRHIWILREPLNIGWFRKSAPSSASPNLR